MPLFDNNSGFHNLCCLPQTLKCLGSMGGILKPLDILTVAVILLMLLTSLDWMTFSNSQRKGCWFESFMLPNQKTTGKEGNGKPTLKFRFTSSKTLIPVSGFNYARDPECYVGISVSEAVAAVY